MLPGNNNGEYDPTTKVEIVDIDGQEGSLYPGLKACCTKWRLLWITLLLLLLTGAIAGVVIGVTSGNSETGQAPDPTPSTPSPSQSFCQMGIDLNGIPADDWFGWSVALASDGSRAAIGSYGDDTGYVRILDWSGSEWVQVGSDLKGEAARDTFGYSVAISSDGSRVAIGAPYINQTDSAGYVSIFDWSGNEWVQVSSNLDGEAGGDVFGQSVALSADGNRIAISAPGNSVDGIIPNIPGDVRIFDWSGSEWVQVGFDLDGEESGDGFGWKVALFSDGNRVAIGAVYNGGNGDLSGHVRIFEWSGSDWTQVGSDLDGEAAGDNFGASVALYRVAIGAPGNDASGFLAGHVRVFDWSGSEWVQVGSDLDGEESDDQFGKSVALSADGNRVAIGGPFNNGNSPYAGHVRIFDWSGSQWNQADSVLYGEGAEDYFGWDVAISDDGSLVAIGAPGNNQFTGNVRIFSSCE